MAIQKLIQLDKFGIELPESYHRLQSVLIEFGNVYYTINVYASAATRQTRAPDPINVITGAIPYATVAAAPGDDIIAKVYNSIKNTPEYKEGCTDV